MKTKRRVIAAAAIGLATAGIIGFGGHTVSAAPATSDSDTSSVDCSYYAKKAKAWAAKAKKLNGKAAEEAYAKSAEYQALYRQCVGG